MGPIRPTSLIVNPLARDYPRETVDEVFIIDADPATRRELELVTQACGHDVRTFVDAQSALTALTRFRPKAVVVDLLLPGISGFQLCETIRTDLGDDRLPLLCLSNALWGSLDVNELLRARFAAEFVSKNALTVDYVNALGDLVDEDTDFKAVCATILAPRTSAADTANDDDVDENTRLNRLAAEYLRDMNDIENAPRKNARVPLSFSVEFASEGELAKNLTQDVPAGGLVVRSADPPAIGSVVELELRVLAEDRSYADNRAGARRIIQAQARVGRHISRPDAQGSAIPWAFGVQFIAPAGEQLEILARIVRRAQAARRRRKHERRPKSSKCRIALVGLPKRPFERQADFTGREGVHLVEVDSVKSALDLVARSEVSAVMVPEGRLAEGRQVEALDVLRRRVGDEAMLIVVQTTSRDLSFLAEEGMCDVLLPRNVTMAELVEKVARRLGVYRRDGSRVPHRAPVSVAAGGMEFDGRVVNVSCGGLLMASPVPLLPATPLRMTFDLTTSTRFCCSGIVARAERQEESQGTQLGISFFDLADEYKSALRDFVRDRAGDRAPAALPAERS